jgi:hypothetical protein
MGLGGLIGLFGLVGVVLAFVLALQGIIGCISHPRLYARSIGTAAATLALSGVLGLALGPAYVRGSRSDAARARLPAAPIASRTVLQQTAPELLHFEAFGFVFHAPGSPWKQIDAKLAGSGRILAMQRAGPIYFGIHAERLRPGVITAQVMFLQRLKASLEKEAVAYKIISEADATYNGITGRLLEVDVSVQGHPTYEQYWMFENNGIGYLLSTWGRDPLEADVKTEAGRLFSDIELTAVQN